MEFLFSLTKAREWFRAKQEKQNKEQDHYRLRHIYSGDNNDETGGDNKKPRSATVFTCFLS